MAEFVHQVDSEAARGATAWVRHYNFPDFERFDAEWTPVHVNIVRDPVERVRIGVARRRRDWEQLRDIPVRMFARAISIHSPNPLDLVNATALLRDHLYHPPGRGLLLSRLGGYPSHLFQLARRTRSVIGSLEGGSTTSHSLPALSVQWSGGNLAAVGAGHGLLSFRPPAPNVSGQHLSPIDLLPPAPQFDGNRASIPSKRASLLPQPFALGESRPAHNPRPF